MNNYNITLPAFINACQSLINNYYTTNYSNLDPHTLSINQGRKYDKIVSFNGIQHTVFAFIDKSTGNIFKPASWCSPAKHPRGNIYATDLGMSCITPFGPKYL